MAMDAYFAMCSCTDQKELRQIRNNLLAYCKTNTLGMVHLLQKLKELTSIHLH